MKYIKILKFYYNQSANTKILIVTLHVLIGSLFLFLFNGKFLHLHPIKMYYISVQILKLIGDIKK